MIANVAKTCQEMNIKSWIAFEPNIQQGSERTLCDRRDRYKILTPCARYNHSKTKAKFQLIVQMVHKKKHLWFFPRVFYSDARVCLCVRALLLNVCLFFLFIFFFLPLLSFGLFICCVFLHLCHRMVPTDTMILVCTKNTLKFFFYLVAVYASREKSSVGTYIVYVNLLNALTAQHILPPRNTCTQWAIHMEWRARDQNRLWKQIKTHVRSPFYMTIFHQTGEVHELCATHRAHTNQKE